ncbi:MAG: adenine-specific methyltransferase EcoRI family protein, partial [Prevotella sp.]|nr:adenine-specific methyltransferase EcoRI family protein [Prevotella sp.]
MNDNLHRAKAAKNDEFYTQLSDIEKELSNYPADTFKNKIIYCPCDVGVDGLDIHKSNFVKYFEMNKERLGYKQLLHTSLQEGYDFHSDYCTRLLNEADIVVTNPP